MARQATVGRMLLAFCAFGLIQLVASVAYAHVIDGYVGILGTTRVAPFVDRIDAVDPRSPVARDGLRVGDRVDLRAMSATGRMDWATYLKDGERYRLPIVRAGVGRSVDVDMDRNIADDPTWQSIRWQFYVRFAGIAVMLAVAGFLVFKRPESGGIATLATLLLLVAVGEDFAPIGAWDMRAGALTALGYAISPYALFAGLALLGTYAARFARPPSRVRRTLTAASYATAAAIATAIAVVRLGYWAGTVDQDASPFASTAWHAIVDVVPYVLPPLCAMLALRDARGAERSRLAWATGSLSILFVAPIVAAAMRAANVDFTTTYLVRNAAFPIAALGVTYALLGHRLLDVGFALNRAAVFALVSVVVVGTFTLVEWALGGWLAAASRSTNVAVGASLALLLGLAIHPIHAWVDRTVDALFFRKRHEAEQALRAFAKQAAFVTDPDVLVARATELLGARTDCTFAEVLLDDGVGNYGGVDENDPALVALRETHDLVRLDAFETVLRGELCFPMSAGGRLLGALVVGPKRLGESFAPDEREAIGALAHGVGVALALLGASPAKHAGDAREPADSPALVQTLLRAIDALPSAVVEKLRGERVPP